MRGGRPVKLQGRARGRGAEAGPCRVAVISGLLRNRDWLLECLWRAIPLCRHPGERGKPARWPHPYLCSARPPSIAANAKGGLSGQCRRRSGSVAAALPQCAKARRSYFTCSQGREAARVGHARLASNLQHRPVSMLGEQPKFVATMLDPSKGRTFHILRASTATTFGSGERQVSPGVQMSLCCRFSSGFSYSTAFNND